MFAPTLLACSVWHNDSTVQGDEGIKYRHNCANRNSFFACDSRGFSFPVFDKLPKQNKKQNQLDTQVFAKKKGERTYLSINQ
jgi:hypothetical protein